MMKSTILCFSIVSVWVLVIKNEISYPCTPLGMSSSCTLRNRAYLHWFPAQHDEVLCSLHHEPSELVAQNSLYFIRLLNFDTQSDRIHRWLDQDAFVLVSRDCQRVQEDLFGSAVSGSTRQFTRDYGTRTRLQPRVCCVVPPPMYDDP